MSTNRKPKYSPVNPQAEKYADAETGGVRDAEWMTAYAAYMAGRNDALFETMWDPATKVGGASPFATAKQIIATHHPRSRLKCTTSQ